MTEDERTLLDFEAAADVREPAPPQQALYHYTNATGFMGIVNSKHIWATHFRHLNDRRELEAGQELVQEAAREIAEEHKRPVRQKELLKAFLESHEEVPTTAWHHPYIASFSEVGNQLSQWRAYAQDGSGISFGIHAEVRYSPGSSNVAGGLWKCIYDPEIFREKVRQDFTRIMDAYSMYRPPEKEVFEQLRIHAANLAPQYKSQAFHEEREWRLVAIPQKGRESEVVRFRAGKAGIVPYLEIPLSDQEDPLDLRRVYVGPSQEEAGLEATKLFLSNRGYDADLVRETGIPYRS